MSVLPLQNSCRVTVQRGGGEQGRPVLTLCLFLSFSMECLGLLSLITYIASRIISLCTSNSNKVNMLLINSGSHVCCSGVDGRLTWHTHTHTKTLPKRSRVCSLHFSIIVLFGVFTAFTITPTFNLLLFFMDGLKKHWRGCWTVEKWTSVLLFALRCSKNMYVLSEEEKIFGFLPSSQTILCVSFFNFFFYA